MKIKETKNGNVKLTLNYDQLDVIRALLYHTRLGYGNRLTTAASEMAIELSDFFGSVTEDQVRFTRDLSDDTFEVTDVTIELVDNDE